MPAFIKLDGPSPITEFAFQLCAFRDAAYDPMGTAILIRPHLLLSARHVLEDYWKLDGRRCEHGMDADFACWALQRMQDGCGSSARQ